MSLLTARQPAYDLTSLARIQAQAASQVGQVQQQYIQAVERERKLNLDQQTVQANNRLKAQMAAAENQQSERRLQVAESAEARQREFADERIKELQRDAAVARSVQQFRDTSTGSPSGDPGLFIPPNVDSNSGPGVLPERDDAPFGVPPDETPQQANARVEMERLEANYAAQIAAGDTVQAGHTNTRIRQLQGVIFGGSSASTDPDVAEGRELLNKERALRLKMAEETYDARYSKVVDDSLKAGFSAQAAAANTPEAIAQEKLQTEAMELRNREAQAKEKRGYTAPMSPAQNARIIQDIGRLQGALAKDASNEAARERALATYSGMDPKARDMIIASREKAGLIPRVMSSQERTEIEKQISGLQATLDGDSSVGSQKSAQEVTPPTQEKYGPVKPDGEQEALDRYLR